MPAWLKAVTKIDVTRPPSVLIICIAVCNFAETLRRGHRLCEQRSQLARADRSAGTASRVVLIPKHARLS